MTVQNKVRPDEARALYKTLESEFNRRDGSATGFLVWAYIGVRGSSDVACRFLTTTRFTELKRTERCTELDRHAFVSGSKRSPKRAIVTSGVCEGW